MQAAIDDAAKPEVERWRWKAGALYAGRPSPSGVELRVAKYYAGATSAETGMIEWFDKKAIKRGLHVLRASCAMPMLSTPIEIEDKKHFDGGIAAPIPFQKALDDGCENIIVVLTRPRDYKKRAEGFKAAAHTASGISDDNTGAEKPA